MSNKRNTPEKFWRRVDSSRGELACWPWKLSTMGGGYGRASWAGLVMGAHRVAWILTHGAIAKGLFVCHRCSENLCCNPGHLFLGTSSRGRRPPDMDAVELSSPVLKKDVDKVGRWV